jgi:ribokinase
MTTPANVCVLGSINMDLVVQSPRFAHPGETVLGGVFETFPGGKGANQAIAAQRIGAVASLIGCVGGDAYGRELIDCIARSGVQLTGLEIRENAATGVGVITIDRNTGENMIVVASGANMQVTAQQIDRARQVIERASILLLQLEVPMRANVHAAGIAREAGVRVILNAAPARDLPPELLGAIDALVVNRAEAAALTGLAPDASPRNTMERLQMYGLEHIVLTLGAEGAIVAERGECALVPAPRVNAVDTVGAGDAFTGALAAALASGRPMMDAARLATAAGSLAVTKPGAIPSLPDGAEVRALAELIDVVAMETVADPDRRSERLSAG